jgi:SAM-dependent methyltransferase
VLAAYIVREERLGRAGYRLLARNFYGVLEVRDDPPNVGYRVRTLYNGAIVHGSQLFDSTTRYDATDYYGPKSGVGRALLALEARGPIRVGSIGLGAGVLASYGRAGDVYRIYDINPLVPRIAQSEFSFYPHLPADKQILLGDARLTLERQDSQQFDLLSVDAFTGDAIPVHLLTNEALELYFRHLKPDGILALHISNRYLDLAPVCARGAESLGKHAMVLEDDGASEPYYSASTWVLVTGDSTWFQAPSFQGASMSPARAPAGFRAWTDDFSNVFQSMKLN